MFLFDFEELLKVSIANLGLCLIKNPFGHVFRSEGSFKLAHGALEAISRTVGSLGGSYFTVTRHVTKQAMTL